MRILRVAAAALVLAVVAPVGVAHAAATSDVNSLGLSAIYDVDATFGWADRSVSVSTVATVSNRVRWPVTTIAFNLAPLRTGNAVVGKVSVDGADVAPTVDDQTVLVPLAAALVPGATVVVRIDYTARLSAAASVDGDAWEFARIDDVLTAYRWIPWLTRTTPFDRPNVGDPFVTASSPDVRVSFTFDRELVVASSGNLVSGGGTSQTFETHNVRDFNFAASPSYQTRSTSVAGTNVTLYYLTLDPDVVLQTVERAIRDYSSKIAPYPGEQLNIAEIGPWSPFESPNHFWVPGNSSRSLLPWIVAHETGHQWFYSAVGNDQARQPFADEALVDFMARNLINHFVASKCDPAPLDQTIYEIAGCYAWVVYVQGDAWLRDLRDRMGSNRFWSALAAYFAAHRGGLGGTYEVIAALAARGGSAAVDPRRFPRTIPPIVPVVVGIPFGARIP